jgi:glycosyltransferase involved in cell wall biosynthesis
VPSEKSKEELNQETKLFPDPVVYYNGYFLNHYFVEPNNHLLKRFELIKKNNMIIAVIGRLEVQKRIDRALKLFQIIIQKKHNLFLIIFGDGKLKSWLQSECRELQIESKTDLLDYVPNLLHYYKQFDVLLFTSDWEGMPLSMWEAMAHEVPIIAPDVGGFKEILEGNNCGLIYEPGNLADAEIKFTRLINDERMEGLQLKKNTREKNLLNNLRKIILF